jgi:uncharacterized protein
MPEPMVIHDLTPAQCRELLARTHLGRLACAKADQPYITPIFFHYDGDEDAVYGFSTLGQKIDWMRGNPKVCVEVEEVVSQFNWTTVLVFGRYEEIHEAGAVRDRVKALVAQHPNWWLPGAAKLTGSPEHHVPVVYRIRVDRLSGRRATRPVGT